MYVFKHSNNINSNTKNSKNDRNDMDKSELMLAKGRKFVILGHGSWLDEKTEPSGDNAEYHVKIIR